MSKASSGFTIAGRVDIYYDIMIRSLEECFFDGMAHLDFPRSFFDHWNISETIINRILELMVEKYRAVYQQNCVFNG